MSENDYIREIIDWWFIGIIVVTIFNFIKKRIASQMGEGLMEVISTPLGPAYYGTIATILIFGTLILVICISNSDWFLRGNSPRILMTGMGLSVLFAFIFKLNRFLTTNTFELTYILTIVLLSAVFELIALFNSKVLFNSNDIGGSDAMDWLKLISNASFALGSVIVIGLTILYSFSQERLSIFFGMALIVIVGYGYILISVYRWMVKPLFDKVGNGENNLFLVF